MSGRTLERLIRQHDRYIISEALEDEGVADPKIGEGVTGLKTVFERIRRLNPHGDVPGLLDFREAKNVTVEYLSSIYRRLPDPWMKERFVQWVDEAAFEADWTYVVPPEFRVRHYSPVLPASHLAETTGPSSTNPSWHGYFEKSASTIRREREGLLMGSASDQYIAAVSPRYNKWLPIVELPACLTEPREGSVSESVAHWGICGGRFARDYFLPFLRPGCYRYERRDGKDFVILTCDPKNALPENQEEKEGEGFPWIQWTKRLLWPFPFRGTPAYAD